MKKIFNEDILEEALKWLDKELNVILATVISTWGSSPRPVSSQMVINNKNKFSGSVSGGCVEANVIGECKKLIKEKKAFEIIQKCESYNIFKLLNLPITFPKEKPIWGEKKIRDFNQLINEESSIDSKFVIFLATFCMFHEFLQMFQKIENWGLRLRV